MKTNHRSLAFVFHKVHTLQVLSSIAVLSAALTAPVATAAQTSVLNPLEWLYVTESPYPDSSSPYRIYDYAYPGNSSDTHADFTIFSQWPAGFFPYGIAVPLAPAPDWLMQSGYPFSYGAYGFSIKGASVSVTFTATSTDGLVCYSGPQEGATGNIKITSVPVTLTSTVTNGSPGSIISCWNTGKDGTLITITRFAITYNPNLKMGDLQVSQSGATQDQQSKSLQVVPNVPVQVDVPISGFTGFDAPSGASTTVTLKAGSQTLPPQTVYLSEIPATGAKTVSFFVTFKPEDVGPQTITATVDPDNTLGESDRSDNTQPVTVNVISPLKLLVVFPEMSNVQVPPYDLNPTSGATMQVPLGSRFTIGLGYSGNGSITSISATYELTNSSVSPQIAASDKPLFPNNVLVEFDQSTATTSKLFQAFHLGSASIVIKPSDSAKPSITVNVVVYEPDSLGYGGAELTSVINLYAHLRGIPPQIIKAIVEQESNFDPNAFRYEPGFDNKYVQNGNVLVYDAAWLPFMLKLDDFDTSRQIALTSDDIAPRQKYFMIDPSTCTVLTDPDTCLIRRINGNDVGISASNIIRANPGTWAISKLPSLLTFTAQTATASSYGYMQPMYVTAREQGWRGPDGAGHPNDLFLPKENISAGTMKLRLSTSAGTNTAQPNFTSSSEVDELFGRAFKRYNGGANPTYRPEVEERIPNFLPALSRQIFIK